MKEKDIITTLISLCEGKLTAEEWKNWFFQHMQDIEKICGRRYFLKIKPHQSFSDIRNVYYGQMAVAEWLKTKNVNFSLSDIYQKTEKKEFDGFCRVEKEKRKESKNVFEIKCADLKEIYPNFFRQLGKSFDPDTTKIEKGKNIAEIQAKEKELSVKFSDELKTFFSHIGAFEFEAVQINFDELDKECFEQKEYLILGEFWHYVDGNKLLYSIENKEISVFGCECRPLKIIKVAETLTEFVEKIMVKHLKEYEN